MSPGASRPVSTLWVTALAGCLSGLVAVVPGWFGLTGPATLIARAGRSAEGSAAPIVAAMSAVSVMVDLAYVAALSLLGFFVGAITHRVDDVQERFLVALAPFGVLAALALALSLLAPGLHALVGPGAWTLGTVAACGVLAATWAGRR